MPMPKEKKTILVVEDDPIYAGFIKTSLLNAGMPLALHHVTTVDQALAYLRGEQLPFKDRSAYPMPAIVLLDLRIPEGGGFPVLKFLRDNGHLDNGKVRVVMLTASSRPQDLQEALQLGAVSYLIKTPVASTIISLVSKFLEPN